MKLFSDFSLLQPRVAAQGHDLRFWRHELRPTATDGGSDRLRHLPGDPPGHLLCGGHHLNSAYVAPRLIRFLFSFRHSSQYRGKGGSMSALSKARRCSRQLRPDGVLRCRLASSTAVTSNLSRLSVKAASRAFTISPSGMKVRH